MSDDYTKSDVERAEVSAPRVTAALRSLGSEHEPPPGWQKRVFEQIDGKPRLADWFLWAVVGACVAAVVVMAVWWWL